LANVAFLTSVDNTLERLTVQQLNSENSSATLQCRQSLQTCNTATRKIRRSLTTQTLATNHSKCKVSTMRIRLLDNEFKTKQASEYKQLIFA